MRSRLGGGGGAPSPSPSPFANLRNDPSFDDGPSVASGNGNDGADDEDGSSGLSGRGYRVYRRRWLMLFYLSLLNLLSDWTGLSVAPIATITSRAYNNSDDGDGDVQSYIQPEALVTVFLAASSVGTALEPWILSRLGLRRTVVFGAFSNMVGNVVKSGGLPPLGLSVAPSLATGVHGTVALYVGFALVGFAQPLFQCTPALLSASWFPEEERTLATSIALNANQLGVGLAFVVGALCVRSPGQVADYFGLLSLLSALAFVGTALQLEDAPPTPPSGSSRILRGTLEVNVKDILQRASLPGGLLAREDGGAGGRDVDDASRLWGRRGDEEGGAGGDGGGSGAAVRDLAKSLLRRHVARRADAGRTSMSTSELNLTPPALATPYSIDEESIYFTEYEGAEPTLTQTPHHLEIDIRDDQIFLAAKACLSRRGFSQALVVFAASGLVINVLSTYLDYLVRGDYYGENDDASGYYGDGSGEASSSAARYVALIGALFQVIIMASSVVVGSFTDKTRSYFVVTLVLLVLGAFALAECGVSLDEDRDGDVRWSMLLVSGLLGPLLPVATELAVELAYPLSENTVLVILQLSCNLLSALFIPLFQAVRDVGVSADANAGGGGEADDDGAALVLGSGRPPYTFSFYLLILICSGKFAPLMLPMGENAFGFGTDAFFSSASTVYFATFNGKYLRLEAELAKKRGGCLERRPLAPSAK